MTLSSRKRDYSAVASPIDEKKEDITSDVSDVEIDAASDADDHGSEIDSDEDSFIVASSDDDEDVSDEELSSSDEDESETELASTLPTADNETDSSDDEAPNNRVGKVPMEWYNDFPHIGYNINGEKVMKPARGDALDDFLDRMDNDDGWRTFWNETEGKSVKLSKEEVALVRRIQAGEHADEDYNPYEPYVDFFTSKTLQTPLTARPEPKRRFVPSKWEAKKVMKIVRAIRQGLIVPKNPDAETKKKGTVYALWQDNDTPRDTHGYIAAPKMKLPVHNESYNPPREYLPTPEEAEAWQSMDPEGRPQNYLPQKYDALRKVPAYGPFIKERFERCLDLYLCPRVRRQRLQIDPESLVPKLPDPATLRPFPTTATVSYEGHSSRIRCTSIDATGQWLISGSDDGTARLWEVRSGYCQRTWQFKESVSWVAWHPINSNLIAVASGKDLILLDPLIDEDSLTATLECVRQGVQLQQQQENSLVKWRVLRDNSDGRCLSISHSKPVSYVTWHAKGDYFAVVCPDGQSSAVVIHQLSKHHSQTPFRKSDSAVQKVLFHPRKPVFFVASQRYIRVYDLVRQALIKKLQSGVKWISSLAVHPSGDHVLIGSYDKRVCWFDMDLSVRPYKTLRYHEQAVRHVAYHPTRPLFASCSDDGSVHVFHGTVYDDLVQNPLLVPVKILKAHNAQTLGALHCSWHPTEPWIVSAGADGSMKLFT